MIMKQLLKDFKERWPMALFGFLFGIIAVLINC